MRILGAVLERSGAPRPYTASRPISVDELELDLPGEGELLVRIEAAGICHSDLSVVNGDRPRPLPMLLGHEAAGIVELVGAGVTGVHVGERVVITFLPRCGVCTACETGGRLPCVDGSAANAAGTLLSGGRRIRRSSGSVEHHLGVSAFATHAVVDARSVVPVDADVPPDVAAVLGCAVLTGGGAVINAGRPAQGETTIVVGMGGVGTAALLVAVALNAGPVIAVDVNPEKLQHALELGAERALTPEDALKSNLRAELVIEAAGHQFAFEAAFALTAPGGRTVTVGLPAEDAISRISPVAVTAEARTIIGSYLGSAVPSRDIPHYVRLWREGRLPLESLISGHVELQGANEAMDDLADGRVLRQVIVF
ncbi:alcohol dehydrogenase catalytic domain-containing protein [Microbacterium sp. NPDC078428]|uniref:alcohol dehydrogenase catalytic domain-containing protein n=1 Tax=Microbacterium sp. NPDC078428 TaxID=3364190 RepID=UPI0037C9B568